LQQATGSQDSPMPGDSMDHQPPQYHTHHHHLHHRHHNNNDNDKDVDDDDRLSAGDDYEQLESSDTSSYASRALRHFTARAATSGTHTDWGASPGGAVSDNHLLYPASVNSAAGLHDDISFVGKCSQNHVVKFFQ